MGAHTTQHHNKESPIPIQLSSCDPPPLIQKVLGPCQCWLPARYRDLLPEPPPLLKWWILSLRPQGVSIYSCTYLILSKLSLIHLALPTTIAIDRLMTLTILSHWKIYPSQHQLGFPVNQMPLTAWGHPGHGPTCPYGTSCHGQSAGADRSH